MSFWAKLAFDAEEEEVVPVANSNPSNPNITVTTAAPATPSYSKKYILRYIDIVSRRH